MQFDRPTAFSLAKNDSFDLSSTVLRKTTILTLNTLFLALSGQKQQF